MSISIVQTNIYSISKKHLKQQYDVLIHAYADTEKEIWGENYIRISFDEYKKVIEKEIVFTAFMNDEVVGTILLSKHEDNHFSFGLLAVDSNYKGLGIGRKLIDTVEQIARELGGIKMNLEILKPQHQTLPFKEQLATWYQRLGYRYLFTKSFIELKPNRAEKAKLLFTPSVFDCYEKDLF